MIYFRVALRMNQTSQWRWKSSMLNTPGLLFDFLNLYDRVPKNRLRVFFATSRELMDEMLLRENSGLLSNSITVEDFLSSGRKIDRQLIKEFEFEIVLQESKQLLARSAITRKLGDESSTLQTPATIEYANSSIQQPRTNYRDSSLVSRLQEDSEWSIGGDHDTPYTFALPISMPQALAWARLLAKVQNGELTP